MATTDGLPACDYRVPVEGTGQFYCRHSRVHSSDGLVDPQVCRACRQYSLPCYLPRPLKWEPRPRVLQAREETPLEYISTEQLVTDTRSLIGRLPTNLAGIAGIPRSGMLPATVLATLLHLPLYSLCRERGLLPTGQGMRLGTSELSGPLLVIDDSVNGGIAMYEAKQALARSAPQQAAIFAAVYPRPDSAGCVDLFARLLPLPHFFEWNLCNCQQSQGIAFDFDGVLCEDFAGNEDNEDEYLSFLETARPRWLPRRHEIPLIVTARLEKYRRPTLEWLRRHGLRVRQLVMGPWPNIALRRAHFQPGAYKGGPYAASPCLLFVESDEQQAAAIFEFSKRPVLCPASGRIFQ